MKQPKLNRQVELQVRTSAPDDLGQQEVDWQPVGTVWAEIKPLRGDALIAAQAEESRADYTVTIRHRPDAAALQTRVKFGGVTYEAVHVAEPEGTRGIWLQMLVKEVRDVRG